MAALAALALGCVAACTGDTGILIRVSRDPGAPATIPRVHLAIGVRAPSDVTADAVGGAVAIPTYVDDVVATETIDTSGSDLATAPYELLLTPSSSLSISTGLEIAAVGFDTEAPANVVGFGAIGHEVHFVRGEVVAFDVVLKAVAAPTADPSRRQCGTLATGGTSIYACRLGCVRFTGADGDLWIGAHDDIDCDGDPHGVDCDDYDWTVNHMATDICNNGKNDDCTGVADDGVDRDGDGQTPCTGDCVDNPAVPGSAAIHTGATEIKGNGVDDNCSGQCDETDDVDHDTYTATGFRTVSPDATDRSCAAAVPDCNDQVATINPGAAEIDGNEFDDDCDGHCDVDRDGDGYTVGDGKNGVVDPPAPLTARCAKVHADCNDDPASIVNGTPASSIHPNAPEICDGLDDDCNGQCDDGLDPDGDGFTVCGTIVANMGGSVCTYVGSATCPGSGAICDCAENNSDIHPGSAPLERCDGLDSACDGVLFPQSTTCFAFDPQNVCRVGSRMCDDLTPPGGFGACVPGTIQAPDGACNAFSGCASDPDPLACVADQLNTTRLSCIAQVAAPAPLALCPSPPTGYDIALPPQGTATCGVVTWDIIGGPSVGPWSVGLISPATVGSPPSQMLSGTCQASLVITALALPPTATQPPPATSVLVIARRGTSAVAIVVSLGGHTTTTCPAGPGVLCAVVGG